MHETLIRFVISDFGFRIYLSMSKEDAKVW
jgi:hypothetical protein